MNKNIAFIVLGFLIISSVTLGVFISKEETKINLNNNNDKQKIEPSKKASVSLTSKTWAWVKTQYNNDKVLEPKQKDRFYITFADDGKFNIKTDCNSGFGSYKITSGNKLEIGQMGSTEMFCMDSQENEFTKFISEVDGYMFSDKGELILNLKFDSGEAVFK